MAREFDQILDEELRRRRQLRQTDRPGTHLKDLKPADPSADTFRQRFMPFSKDPIEDLILDQMREGPGKRINPGDNERFGDPTKIIAQAGQATATDETKLPPGFKFVDEPSSELPPGFKFVDAPVPQGLREPAVDAGISQSEPEAREPAVNAGISQVSEDPFERAALRTQRSVRPPEGRQEGAFTRAVEGAPAAVVQGVGDELARVGRIAEKGFTTGNLAPNELLDAAMLASPAPIARGTGRVVSNLAMSPAQRQQLEAGVTSIPNVAEGGVIKQATGRALSAAPIGGGALRKAAERSTAELQAAGEAAAMRPTGVIPTQNLAGSNVRRGIQQTTKEALENEEPINRGLVRMLGTSNEDMIGKIAKMSMEVKPGANINLLVDLRKAVPTKDWGNVQGALIDRMGQSARTGKFEPATWISNYGNMSARSKNVIFGKEGSGLRYHLDSIEAISRRAPSWQQFQRERATLGSKFGAGSLILGAMGIGTAMAGPMAVLGTVIPMAVVARGLSRPITAAPLAQWSSAFERVVRSGGGPQAVAAFTIATRNLSNTLGVPMDADTFLKGPQDGQPVE